MTADAYRWARGFEPLDDEPMAVFLDPPYREFEIHADKVNQLLQDLVRKLPARSIIAVESRRALDEGVLPDLDRWDIRRYGGTQMAIRVLSRDGETNPALPLLDGPAES
jgi:16S rRNA (guanine966-N2)-methyltransferase